MSTRNTRRDGVVVEVIAEKTQSHTPVSMVQIPVEDLEAMNTSMPKKEAEIVRLKQAGPNHQGN